MCQGIWKNDQLGEYFAVITTSGWFLLEYTSQNNIHVVELLKVTASKLCKRSRTLLNIDLWSKSHLESELLPLKWISRQQLPCDYHLCASVTYVCCVSNKQIWQNYHLSKLSLKCESTVLQSRGAKRMCSPQNSDNQKWPFLGTPNPQILGQNFWSNWSKNNEKWLFSEPPIHRS